MEEESWSSTCRPPNFVFRLPGLRAAAPCMVTDPLEEQDLPQAVLSQGWAFQLFCFPVGPKLHKESRTEQSLG